MNNCRMTRLQLIQSSLKCEKIEPNWSLPTLDWTYRYLPTFEAPNSWFQWRVCAKNINIISSVEGAALRCFFLSIFLFQSTLP